MRDLSDTDSRSGSGRGLGPKNTVVSVIVCTRDRAHLLERLLASLLTLAREDNSALEVVLVDNGSTDDTAGVIAQFKARAPFVVKSLHEPRRGWAFGENAGVRAAAGDLLVFTDDDCVVSSDWIDRFRDLLGACDEAHVIGGRVKLYDIAHSRITIKEKEVREELRSHDELFGFVHGCNLGVTRKTFETIGLFDARFGPGAPMRSGSDVDFLYRAAKAGVPVLYDPSPVVFHNHGRVGESAVRALLNRYATGKGALAMKYLLRRDLTIGKLVYWQIRGHLRDCIRGRMRWRPFFADLANLMKGGVLYLTMGLGRPTT